MIARLSYVMCDECGTTAECGDDSIEARDLVKNIGFVRRRIKRSSGIVRSDDLCRECAARSAGRVAGEEGNRNYGEGSAA